MLTRRTIIAAAIALGIAHIVVLATMAGRPSLSPISNLTQIAVDLLAVAGCLMAARNSGPFGRLVWNITTIGVVLQTIGQALATYYFDVLHASTHTAWPSDEFYFFWVVPLIITLFVTTRAPGKKLDWVLAADALQICIFAITAHVFIFYMPSHWQAAELSLGMEMWWVYNARDVLLVLGFVLRGLGSSTRWERNFYLRTGSFFLIYAIGESRYLHVQALSPLLPGTWLDLTWSLPFCLLACLSASWNQAEEAAPAAHTSSRTARLLLSQLSPLVLPAMVLLMALNIAVEEFWVAATLVIVSFAVASARQLRLQTEQFRNAEELQQSQQRLALHLEKTPLGVIEWNTGFRVVDWNSTAEEIFGYRKSEAMGRHASFIIPPSGMSDVERLWSELLQQSGGAHNTNENLTRDGRTIWCEWYNTPLVDASGKILGVASLVHDVTEQRVLEDKLRQSQKMEAVGRLAGGIAHDFNNLLTIIKGYGQLLGDGEAAGSPRSRSASQICAAADRAAGLTHQLLAFSRQQVLQPQPINMNTVVRNLDSMLRRVIGEDIEMKTITPNDLGTVKADPGQVEQVIMNLVVNARDAMPNGGKLTVETSNVELDKDYIHRHLGNVPPGHYVLLTISDSGTGMEADIQSHIFEPFFTTKKAGKGTGLGLATVYGIVKQSSGYIWVYSEPGRGTTFKIYLPRVDAAAQELPKEKVETFRESGTETILLVEDDRQLRDLIQAVLASHGYTVLRVQDAAEAQRISENNNQTIHLLLTDVVMPVMNGRELARYVTTRRPTIKVLFMSGYTDSAIEHHGVLEPGMWFLQKPFTPTTLIAKVREVLDAPVVR